MWGPPPVSFPPPFVIPYPNVFFRILGLFDSPSKETYSLLPTSSWNCNCWQKAPGWHHTFRRGDSQTFWCRLKLWQLLPKIISEVFSAQTEPINKCLLSNWLLVGNQPGSRLISFRKIHQNKEQCFFLVGGSWIFRNTPPTKKQKHVQTNPTRCSCVRNLHPTPKQNINCRSPRGRPSRFVLQDRVAERDRSPTKISHKSCIL